MSSAESTAGRSLPTNATRPDGTPFYRGGCAKGMPRLGACASSCLHRINVESYREWRHNWEEARENGEAVQMEDDDYAAAYPPPTFRAWLTGGQR